MRRIPLIMSETSKEAPAIVDVPLGQSFYKGLNPTVQTTSAATAEQVVQNGLGVQTNRGGSGWVPFVPGNTNRERHQTIEGYVNREIKYSNIPFAGGRVDTFNSLPGRAINEFDASGTAFPNRPWSLEDQFGNKRVFPNLYLANATEVEDFSDVLSGSFDSVFQSVADTLVNNGLDQSIVTIGSEVDRGYVVDGPPLGSCGGGTPYYGICTGPLPSRFQEYNDSFDHIADIFLSTSPNFRMAVAFNSPVNFGRTWDGVNIEEYMIPTRAEFMGTNDYDKINETSIPGHIARWTKTRNLCIANNKKMWFSEWGLWSDESNVGNGDRPDFVQAMWDFMVETVQILGQTEFPNHYYWTHAEGNLLPSALEGMPNGFAKWQELWGS